MANILGKLPAKQSHFPVKYLGLPLTTARLRRIDFQPLVDKTVAKLNGWNRRNLSHARRLTLVQSVLTPPVIYFLLALKPPKATLEEFDNKRRQLLWAGTKRLTGGKCKVNWIRTARSKKNGGLGVLHLKKFARALRLGWLWRVWNLDNKPWTGEEIPCNDTDQLLFAAATTITIGDGRKTKFWDSAWMQGRRPRDVAPSLFEISKRKNRTLHEALHANTWIRDIDLQHPSFSARHLAEFVQVWTETRQIHLRSGVQDEIAWKLTESK